MNEVNDLLTICEKETLIVTKHFFLSLGCGGELILKYSFRIGRIVY